MSDVEVVISGMSGSFPECKNIPEFREKLFANENLITENDRKWPSNYMGDNNIPHATGKYPADYDNKFDQCIFRLSSQIVENTSSMGRMILEKSYEAVIDAGLNPQKLSGSNGGVFTTQFQCETDANYMSLLVKRAPILLAMCRTFLSNRISFAYNLQGPSCTFSETWEGGISALAKAYRYIKDGGDCAFVSVSSSIIDPKFSIQYSKFGFLSADGLCRAFDENADGYGRSEATVVLFLQRADIAKRHYATVLFAEVVMNFLHENTILNASEESIEKALAEIYGKNKGVVGPEDVSFLELEAPGLKHLDRKELNAVSKVMCNDKRLEPLLIGSVKSNAGHTEAASSLVSLVKAVIALETERIPANINFSKPNADIEALKDGKVKVVAVNTKLPGPLVAVNSIGLTGGIGHVVLRQNPKISNLYVDDNLPRVILLQGRMEDGLQEILKKAHSMPLDKNFVSMVNDVFCMEMNTHNFRAYTVLPFTEKATSVVKELPLMAKPIWFTFSGMGSQWTGMGEGLLKIPVFAEAIAKCDAVLKPKGLDIYEIITTKDESVFDNILHSFVGIASIQVGLVDIMKALDIVPDGLLGHSAGETACAYADGCFTLEQTVLSAYAKGAASNNAETIKGKMAAVGKGYKELSLRLPPHVEIACHNSSISCTISGPAATVEEFVEELKSEGTFARILNTANIAYHSKYIAPAGPYLLKYLKQIIPNPTKRSEKWVSTSVPECNWGSELASFCSAEYHTNNLLGHVLFEEGCEHIPKNAVVVEIAPHGLLQPILKKSLPEECVSIPLASRIYSGNDAIYFLLSAVGKLFLNGFHPKANALFPAITYPVPRNTPSLAPFVSVNHTIDWNNTKYCAFGHDKFAPEFTKVDVSQGSPYQYLTYHEIDDKCVIPSALYLYLTWSHLSTRKNSTLKTAVIFEDVIFHKNLLLSLREWREFRVEIMSGSGNFQVLLESENGPTSDEEAFELIASGNVRLDDSFVISDWDCVEGGIVRHFTPDDFYGIFYSARYKLGGPFRNVSRLEESEFAYNGEITWNDNWIALLDSAVKAFLFEEFQGMIDGDGIRVPWMIRRLVIQGGKFSTLQNGNSISFRKCKFTRRFLCDGLEMSGVSSQRWNFQSSFEPESGELRFMPHVNPDVDNLDDFVELCLNIAADHVWKFIDPESKLLIMEPENEEMEAFIRVKAVACNNPVLKEKIKISKIPIGNFPRLFVSRPTTRQMTTEGNGDVFFLGHRPDNSFAEKFDLVSRSEIFPRFTLWKKASEDISREEIHYESHAHVTNGMDVSRSEAVVKRTVSIDDLSLIVSNKPTSRTKRLFILDAEAPPFSTNDPLYKEQIARDLPVAVLKGGKWGTYRRVYKTKERDVENKPEIVVLNSQEISVKYSKLYKGGKKTALEYSGVSEDGEKVAGIATFRKGSKAISDPLLTWHVPHEWSLEEASKVPVAYALTCYILFALPIFPAETIFLNARETNDFVKACLTLALSAGFHIIVAVPSEKDKLALKTFFPWLKENMILNNGDCDYEVELLRKPRLMVINCQRELKHMNACMNSVAEKGFYVDMTGNSAAEHSFGMFYFFGNRSFHCIKDGIFTLLARRNKLKTHVYDSMREVISKGMVRLYRETGYIVSSHTISNRFENQRELIYDEHHSYFIFGSGKKAGHWKELLEWLTMRGARKIVVALDQLALKENMVSVRRYALANKSTVIFTCSRWANSVDGASCLLEETNRLAPLKGIFFVSAKNAEIQMANISEASKNFARVHFVSLFSGGLMECERRRSLGLPAAVVHSSKFPERITEILNDAKEFFGKTGRKSVIYNISHTENAEKKLERVSYYWPSSIESLLEIGDTVGADIDFVEKTSMSPKYADVKGVYPMFIIPAVGEGPLQSVIRNSLYPVFCANQTEEFHPAEIWATRLAAAVERIQPRGPVTIVGETWKSCVVLELGQMLREKGRMVKLILLEGGPADWKKSVFALGNPDTYAFDHRLLEELFSFNPLVKSLRLSGTTKWEKALEACLSVTKCPSDNKEGLKAGVNAVRSSLLIVHEYELRKSSMDVFHIKHTVADHLLGELCQKEEIKLLEFEKYEDFLRNPSLSNIVNNEILFKWW